MTANDRPTSTGAAAFSIVASDEGEAYRLRLAGELDIAGIETAQAALAAAAETAPARLVIDLSGLAFIDSSGLRFIIATRALCDERGIELSLVPGGLAVQRIFEVTRLDQLLPFADG